MWKSKKTLELERLEEEYYKTFNTSPVGYEGVDYGKKNYKQYVKDLKEAIEKKKELPTIIEERLKEIYGDDIILG